MNQIDLSEKSGVVTGGAQEIGLATARRLVESGARVSLGDIDRAALDSARSMLGDDTAIQMVDICSYVSVADAAASTEETVGCIDILVNSAGIAGKNAPLHEYDLDEWRRVIDIDLNGTSYTNRAVLPA